jgi:site-specific DNA-methyltransferase (adenine-specific)
MSQPSPDFSDAEPATGPAPVEPAAGRPGGLSAADYGDSRLQVVSIPLADLQLHPRNPRRGDVEAIAESLEQHQLYRPIVVQQSTRHVLVGNHTYRAATHLGWQVIDAVVLDVDDVEATRIMLVDNRTSDLGTYDDGVLAGLLRDLPDLIGTGYNEAALDEILDRIEAAEPAESLTDPDDAPGAPADPISRPGDVWLLGPHRLVVGDSTDRAVVARAANGRKVDLLFTDPPYGVAYTGGTKDKLTIQNDDLDEEALGEFLTQAFAAARAVMAPGAAYYICSPAGNLELPFRVGLKAVDLPLRQVLVWLKDRFTLGRQDYQWQHESMLYGWRPGGEPPVPPHFDLEHDTILYGWREGAGHTWHGGRKQTTVWSIPRPSRNDVHPTMKPVALVERAIENSTAKGGLVLDTFGGSGSTLIAAHRTGRVAALVELDLRYADVICRRFQEHTGVVPRRERDGDLQPVEVSFTAEPAAAA